jgi:hypothetical protein
VGCIHLPHWYELWCAFGTPSGQLAEKFANQIVAKSAAQEKADKLKRLHRDQDALGTFTRATPEAIKAAEDAVASAVTAKTKECVDVGRNCRLRIADETARRAELAQVMRDQATTAKADDLDAQITAEEAVKVDVKTAEKDIDPQATSISKAFDMKVEKAAFIGQIIFAFGIEIGSGLGLWLVFGHGGEAGAPAPKPAPAPEPEPLSDEERQKADRKRFFATCVFHGEGKYAAAVMHGAYVAWCKTEATAPPMGVQAFCTRSPWTAKKRIGGVVHYLNCGIAPGLVRRTAVPALKVVTS